MEYKLKGGMPGMPQIPPGMPMVLIVLGGGFMFFGALLFANEWLLRYIVAGLFVVFGALLALLGLRAKRMLG
jgi:hypothetical protein